MRKPQTGDHPTSKGGPVMGPSTGGAQGSPSAVPRLLKTRSGLAKPSAGLLSHGSVKGACWGKFRALRAKDKARHLRQHMHPLLHGIVCGS